MVAKEENDKSGAHTLWATVVGALLGGGLSILAGYQTSVNEAERANAERTFQVQREHEERHRASYSKLLAEAEKYRLTLLDMMEAVRTGNQQKYEEADEASWDQSAALYGAIVEAEMIFSDEELELVEQLKKFFAAPQKNTVDEMSLQLDDLQSAIDEGTDAMRKLGDQARKEFAGKSSSQSTPSPSWP